LLLQFPILISMYSVLRAPVPNANIEAVRTGAEPEYVNNHLPTDSRLYEDVTQHTGSGTSFLFMNLQCSLVQAGTQAQVSNSAREPAVNPETGQPITLDCGDAKFPDVIPYGVLLLVMIGTTFYQQRQMQKASPPNAQSTQQQAIMKFMPLMFAFFGLSFPAGLVLYWTSSNAFQIAQQSFLLRAGHIGPDALERRMAEQRARQADPSQQGFFSRLMEKAQGAQQDRGSADGHGNAKTAPTNRPKGSSAKRPAPKTPPKPAKQRPAKRPPAPKPPSSDDD
jgi:YidC/Oxa1 family membrane protein insertase